MSRSPNYRSWTLAPAGSSNCATSAGSPGRRLPRRWISPWRPSSGTGPLPGAGFTSESTGDPMQPEQFLRFKQLVQEARELPPGEQETFLARACADDPELRAEAASFLAGQGQVPQDF